MDAIERYAAPRSLAEAASLMREGRATVLAGGTDLMPQTRAGRQRFAPLLLNLRRVDELAGVERRDGCVRVGALATITQLLDSALVRERANLLWQACARFASDQVRNAATLGGNLCNASPAGDTLVPLLALDARVVLVASEGEALASRSLPLGQFLLGPGRTARAPHELLAAVEIPLSGPAQRGEFYKFGTRAGLDISTISIAVSATVEAAAARDVRIALGAVAPTVVRARRAEALLEGRPASDAQAIDAAVRAAGEEISPIDDVRASAWYRRELVRNILRRMLTDVCRRPD